MSLQNTAQGKRFAGRGETMTKQARTKSFFVWNRASEKRFATGSNYTTKAMPTRASRYQQAQANLGTRKQFSPGNVAYATSSFSGARQSSDASKLVDTSAFAGTRPFLVQGKSQKALGQQDKPLTIEQVRELLNKNK